MKTAEYFAAYPVFSLDEATQILQPPGGRSGTVERLKHHLESQRLKLVARGVYAVVPAGIPAERFQPDPFLVASAARPDAVFSHHSALELLGAAHSVWREYTLYTRRRRRPLSLLGARIRFLDYPTQMQDGQARNFGTRKVERHARLLKTTGPERTLVEGFRRPNLTGGLQELVLSASGFSTLDLNLLEEILARYNVANLWAATGWFLERFHNSFHVPGDLLERLARHRPRSPQYLERGQRGGTLAARWNLIISQALIQRGEPDER